MCPRRTRTLAATTAVIGLAAGAATAATLVDNGMLGPGRTVSFQWTVFQPFTVTGKGWYVDTIGVDGFADGSVDFADILALIGAWGPCP